MALPVIHLDRPQQTAFTGWSGEVLDYSNLPSAAAVDGQFWMVLNPSGSRWLLNYKASGLYLSESGAWRKINDAQLLLNDSQFAVYNTADNTKQIAFNVAAISTGNKRTATWQDKDITVAGLSDIVYTTPLEIKTAYESNANTNAFTDAEKTKLAGIEAGAQVNTLNSVVAGTNISIDATDPLNPVISSTGGGVSRNNYVLVKSKADLPAPIGGVITLQDGFSYEINGTISLGTDRIVTGVSNIVYGIDKSNDVLVYTGSGAMITSTNQDFSLNKVTTINSTVGSTTFDFIGSGANRVEIAENVFTNSASLGSFKGGFATIIFRNNLIVNNSEGIEFYGVNSDLIITDNLFDGLVGSVNYVNLPSTDSAEYHTVIISRNMFEYTATQFALNISNLVIISDGGLIAENVFEGSTNPINGINGNTPGWDIPNKANINYIGLVEQFLNWGADGAFGTTATVDLSPIIRTESLSDYGPFASTIDCILIASVTHQQNGQTVRVEINDVTNGNVAVAGSQVDFVVPVANTYYSVTTPEVALNPDNEYNIKITRLTGTGNNLAGARSAVWKIKAF